MPHKTSTLVGRLSLAALLAGLALSATVTVSTQQPSAEQAAPQLLSLTVVKIKPDMVIEWQEFQRAETIPMLKKSGAKSREAWATGVFGEGFEYAFIAPVEKMAQYDQPSPAVRALGEEGARAYGAKNRRFIASTHTYLLRTRPDLSYMPQAITTPTFAVIANLTITPGRAGDFEALVKSTVAPGMKQAGVVGYVVAQTVLGGNVNSFTTVTYVNSYADLDQPWGLEKALGAAGLTKLSQKFSGIIAQHERFISRYVADLSFRTSGS